MDPLRTRRGLTLAETIIAIFILIAGFVVMSRLFHAALRYQATIDSQQIAVLLAESKMEEIRAWSRSLHAPRGTQAFTNWNGCPGSSGATPDANYPDYTVSVTTTAQELYSPCSLFEQEFTNPAQRKCLESSARKVQIDVAWKDRVFSLVSLVAAPPGEPAAAANALRVSPSAPVSLAAAQQQHFTAQAFDSNGNPLPDVTFLWYVAGVGDGTVAQTREGGASDLLNQIFDATPPPAGPLATGVGPGPCVMVARARYRGKDILGVSGPIDLLP